MKTLRRRAACRRALLKEMEILRQSSDDELVELLGADREYERVSVDSGSEVYVKVESEVDRKDATHLDLLVSAFTLDINFVFPPSSVITRVRDTPWYPDSLGAHGGRSAGGAIRLR